MFLVWCLHKVRYLVSRSSQTNHMLFEITSRLVLSLLESLDLPPTLLNRRNLHENEDKSARTINLRILRAKQLAKRRHVQYIFAH